jgi:peptidoglycan-associated lipoprotein
MVAVDPLKRARNKKRSQVMNHSLRVLTLAGLLAVAACATDQTRDDTGTAGAGAASPSPSSSATGGSTAPAATPTAARPGSRVVYFDFDSAEIRPEGAALIEAWAKYLAANPGARARLEGHTDERGTREYNIGLGERRGNSVLRALTSRGVSDRQLSVTSFGEERPVASGHDEGAWSQNRRVEIVQ